VRKKRASGEGTLVYDEKRDLWMGRVSASIDPKRRAVYAKTQGRAREKLRRAAREAERGLVTLRENSRLGDYLDQWLSVVRSRVEDGRLAVSTAAGYERDVRRHIVPSIGRVPLRKLTPAQVEAMFGAMRSQGLAPKTIMHVRGTLSRAMRDAQRDRLVETNVVRLVDPPRLPRRDPSAFSVEEFRRIAAVCSDDRLGVLFLLTAYTGLRRSEAVGLRWRDVSLDEGTFQVREGLHQVSASAERVTGKTGLVRSHPKTDASGNRLPLSKQALEMLRDHRATQAAERLSCPQPWPHSPEDTPIFASALGTPLHPSNVSRAWRRILNRARVAHRTADGRARGMHELRRTFATRLRDRGVPLEDVQRLGRWASSKMLLEVYSASDDGRLRRAAEAAGEALSE
jgi:integrase